MSSTPTIEELEQAVADIGYTLITDKVRHGGITRFLDRTITVDPRLRRRELRAILCHELIHAERGSFPGWVEPREEATVMRETARRLIDFDQFIDAIKWADSLEEVALELDVDFATVATYCRILTGEQAKLAERHAGRAFSTLRRRKKLR